MVMDSMAGMRLDYGNSQFDEDSLAGTWQEQFRTWLEDAVTSGVTEPNAMVLATTDGQGGVSTRTVLCKGQDGLGITFFTNYNSEKSSHLHACAKGAATFPWLAQHRQVNLRGHVERLAAPDNAEYWTTRPRGSQLGAWASMQSTPVGSRQVLDAALDAVTKRFADVEAIPLPSHWGGWRLVPQRVEFWQGRSNRLHDRLRFERDEGGAWRVVRLCP
jgi:pyridoxamine 5'-phosphate oxidase